MRGFSAATVALVMGLSAAAALVFMMVYTTWTVVSRQFFDTPVLGVLDIMELALVVFIFVAMPGVFLRNENVTVDILDSALPARVVSVLKTLALLITLAFLGVCFVAMLPAAAVKYASWEVTMTLGIHRFVHWVPILFGFGGAFLATLWVLLRGPVRDRGAEAARSADRDGAG